MIVLPMPAALHGDALAAELRAAGIAVAQVVVVGHDLHIDAAEDQRPAAVRVVDAHVPPAPQADPDDDLAARIQAVHDDPQVSASVKKLTAALLGLNGDAAVAGRPTGAP